MGILSALKELSTFVGKAAAGTHYDSRGRESGNLGHIRVRRKDSVPTEQSEPVAYRTRARLEARQATQASLPPAIDPYTFVSECADAEGAITQYECRGNRSPHAAVTKFMQGPEVLKPGYGCITPNPEADPRYIYNEYPRESLSQTGYDAYLAAGGTPLRKINEGNDTRPSFSQLCSELVSNYRAPVATVIQQVPVPYEVTVPVPYTVTVPVIQTVVQTVTVPTQAATATSELKNPLLAGSIGVGVGLLTLPIACGAAAGIWGVCKAYKAIKRRRAARQVNVEMQSTSRPATQNIRNKYKIKSVRPTPQRPTPYATPVTIANVAAQEHEERTERP